MIRIPGLQLDDCRPAPAGSLILSGLVLALSLSGASAVRGLSSDRLPSQYLITAWEDQLPQNTVRAIVQDRQGYLWLGTQDGLVRFDGVAFAVLDEQNTPGLRSSDIRALAADEQGRLWVGTRSGGLHIHAEGRLEPSDAPLEADEFVTCLLRSRDDSIWIGTRSGTIVRAEGSAYSIFGPEHGLPGRPILALHQDHEGTVWASAVGAGLLRFDGDRFSSHSATALAGETIVSLASDSSGRLWIGTLSSGAFRLDPHRPESAEQIAGTEQAAVMALAVDRDGNAWIGSSRFGLLRWYAGRGDRLDTNGGLSKNSVLALLEDREGNLWVGTEGGGVNRLRDASFRTFGPAEGLSARNVWNVLEDRTGSMWIGTDSGGLNRLTPQGFTPMGALSELSTDGVVMMFEDSTGELWVTTQNHGLGRVRNGAFEPVTLTAEAQAATILDMAQDAQGELWMAARRGVFRWQNDRALPFEAQPDLMDDRPWLVTRGPGAQILIGTDGEGLKILHGETLTTVGPAQGLPVKTISSLHTDREGTIWIGTYGGGLARYRDGNLAVFRSRDGLLDDVIFAILEDELGNLWMSCNKGIFRVAKSDLEAFASGRAKSIPSRNFGASDGMREAECNGVLQPSGWKSRNGQLWFPTIDGVVSVDPQRLVTNPIPPSLVIERADVDGRQIDPTTEPTLSASAKRLEITYTGLSFFDPDKVRFRYRLEGYDQDWLPVTSERKATYTNLPPGRRYRFHLTAANSDGIWSDESAGFAFAIEPRFYQRPWVLVGMAVLLGLLSWSAFRLRVRQLVRRTQQLETQVAERTAEVVAQRDQLRSANDQLTRLNQFKSEFLGIAAHDLKNPLSVIYGYAGLMISKGGNDPSLVRTARRIAASANQMLNIVSDLLDTTAIDSGKLRFEPQLTDLGELVTNVLESHRVAAADRQIAIHFHEEGDVTAAVDQEKMTRAVQNLVSNAIRYTRPNTRIDVSVLGTGSSEDPRVRITVRDEGPGMTQEQIAQIFERFVRLAAKHNLPTPSTGLGLSIVKQFVEIHGGNVWVESSVGQGSAFHIEVPAVPPTGAGERAPGSVSASAGAPNPTREG